MHFNISICDLNEIFECSKYKSWLKSYLISNHYWKDLMVEFKKYKKDLLEKVVN